MKWLFAILSALLVPWPGETFDLQAVAVKQQFDVLQTGLHRTVHNKIQLTSRQRLSNCTLAYRQLVPSGAYLDLDQLDALTTLGHRTISPRFNVETPEWKASNHVVTFYSQFRILNSFLFDESLQFPLHLRYHRPQPGGGYSIVRIGPPSVLMHCADGVLLDDEDDVRLPCYDLNNQFSEKLCTYKPLPMDRPIWTDLSVPVADLNLQMLTAFVTIWLSILTAAVLVWQAFRMHWTMPADARKVD